MEPSPWIWPNLNVYVFNHQLIYIIITIQFATKKQLKDLTHIFFLQIPCYKLYKKCFFYVLTLKYMCQFEMNSKNLTQR